LLLVGLARKPEPAVVHDEQSALTRGRVARLGAFLAEAGLPFAFEVWAFPPDEHHRAGTHTRQWRHLKWKASVWSGVGPKMPTAQASVEEMAATPVRVIGVPPF
jgi:hypothetical protein